MDVFAVSCIFFIHTWRFRTHWYDLAVDFLSKPFCFLISSDHTFMCWLMSHAQMICKDGVSLRSARSYSGLKLRHTAETAKSWWVSLLIIAFQNKDGMKLKKKKKTTTMNGRYSAYVNACKSSILRHVNNSTQKKGRKKKAVKIEKYLRKFEIN